MPLLHLSRIIFMFSILWTSSLSRVFTSLSVPVSCRRPDLLDCLGSVRSYFVYFPQGLSSTLFGGAVYITSLPDAPIPRPKLSTYPPPILLGVKTRPHISSTMNPPVCTLLLTNVRFTDFKSPSHHQYSQRACPASSPPSRLTPATLRQWYESS